ncbi:MAG: ABC transporter permease [Candidatus Omnitrophota bacterium]|nr:MAG: ABC transporter permease [Candidatus Omnitrophota bacterium]
MVYYIGRRLIGILPLLIGITIISFAVIHIAPGGPVELATTLDAKVTAEARQRLMHLYGLDKPLHIQYIDWLLRLVKFDFGNSFLDGRKVIVKIAERIPITLLINVLSLFLILIVAIPIGITSAVKVNSFYDKFMTVFVFIGFAIPSFWLALLLMSFFGIKLQVLPVLGIKSLFFDEFTVWGKVLDVSRHLILPVFVAAFVSLAGMSRYMKTNMLNVLHENYIRTARAKGLPKSKVIYKHALKNALLPVITILGLSIPGLIGGSVITETVFSIPGMGRLAFEAVMARDYPVIMAVLVIGAILTLLGNLIADISYCWADPRIRVGKGKL